MDLKKYIYDIPDFPKKGVTFRDITPLLNNAKAYKYTIDKLTDYVKSTKATVIVAPEARGFLFAPAVAYSAGIRFVLVRKPGKLPRDVYEASYTLEYGENKLQIHKDDLKENDKVVIIDDVVATGGTIDCIAELCHKTKNISVIGVGCLIDLKDLHNENFTKKYNLVSLVNY